MLSIYIENKQKNKSRVNYVFIIYPFYVNSDDLFYTIIILNFIYRNLMQIFDINRHVYKFIFEYGLTNTIFGNFQFIKVKFFSF